MPQTPEKWLNVSKRFFDQWNFPNCLGSMDGKHVAIQAPIHPGTKFFNYKATFSIVSPICISGRRLQLFVC